MAVKLVEAPLPKSTSGRQPIPIDQTVASALVDAFRDPANRVTENGRPRTLGTGDNYPTKGKASGVGRKYADHVSEALKCKVAVNIYGDSKNDKGEFIAPFHWRIYCRQSEETDAS